VAGCGAAAIPGCQHFKLAVRKKDPVQCRKLKVTGNASVFGIQSNHDYGRFRWIHCIAAHGNR
jgi:hypothetical protein